MSQTTAPPTMPLPPFNQWQSFYPSNPSGFGYDQQPATINDQIYATVMGNAERAKQLSESQIYGTVKGNAAQAKQQAANDIARDILRAVDHNGATNSQITELTGSGLQTAIERNGATNGHITELSSAQLATAIERNGFNNMSTTERVNSQLATAIERNGSTNNSAIERTAGEARLTTVVADAASRQAANDSARDILRGVDRVGMESVLTTKDAYNGLLASIERNAGEGRIQTLTSSGILDNSLRDVRYSILGDVNRVGNDLTASNVQTFNVLNKAITDSAWEARTAISTGFQNLGEENLRTKFDLSRGMGDHYASLMLESQKLGHFMSSKADGHFSANQLELQKVKEGLSMQSAQNFAITQLEAQKNREAIQMQLADAKYAALQSQQFLADKLCECCCSIKEKIDDADRDRLRDNLIVNRDENAFLKFAEYNNRLRGDYGYSHGHGRDRGHDEGRR